MKTFKILILTILMINNLVAQNFIPNNDLSKVTFVIKNLGINVNGSFSGVKGTIIFNAKDLNSSEINLSVNANSINTDNSARDKHLRKDEYFGVEKFPLITFKSTKISAATRLNRYNIEGNLTIKGITKPIKFELIAIEKDNNLDLKCSFEINRRNFKVGGNSMILSDNVKMNIAIIAKK